MGKILLIILVVAAVYLVVRALSRSIAFKSGQRHQKPDENMVRCRHCGLHLPQGESIAAGDAYFCSEEHRKLNGS